MSLTRLAGAGCLMLLGCGAHTAAATRAQDTIASRWYGPAVATAIADVQLACPAIPRGCFGRPPACTVELCYCPAACEPRLWDRAPGLSPTGVWAGQGKTCACRAH